MLQNCQTLHVLDPNTKLNEQDIPEKFCTVVTCSIKRKKKNVKKKVPCFQGYPSLGIRINTDMESN